MNRIVCGFKVRRLIPILLGMVLIVSCSVSRKYTKEASEKWEQDILKFEQLDKTNPDPANSILFAGSSSIRLWSTIQEDVAPYPVIQRGFGGSKFSDLAIYADRIVYPHQFKALVIFEANDITGSKNDKSPEEVVRLFRNIVQTVRKKFADQPIFLIEITPTKSRWAVWPLIKQVNNQLKQECNKLHNTYFIDSAAAYLNINGEPRTELFVKDMLHQNKDGYKIWGALIKARLDEVLSEAAPK